MKIESDIRVRVDEMLRVAEFAIAFPQRDLHIQTLRPLDLRILRDGPNDNQDLRKVV